MANQTFNKLTGTRYMVFLSVMAAILLLLGLVPNMGYIRLAVLSVTIIHIPVIIGAVLLDCKAGAILGFLFGLTSMITATFINPNPIESPLFSPFYTVGEFQGGWKSVLLCFVPRILVGIVAWVVSRALLKTKMPKSLSLGITGVVASLTNTILVLGGIYVLFRVPYAAAYGIALDSLFGVLGGVVLTNGLAEAAVAGILTAAIGSALMVVMRKLTSK